MAMAYYITWFICAYMPFYIEADTLVVETSYGKVRGTTISTATGKEVDVWYGIPYAEKPLGKLRFRPSIPTKKWKNTLDTIALPSACMQNVDTQFGDFVGAKIWIPNTPISEDCLYINVVVPKPRPTNTSVMVWIYGGGFNTGSNSLNIYDHTILVSEENIIIVSMQYRLAALGFLYFGTKDVPGNAGFFDQVLALEWIRDNIASFGGNPNSITIFGESAGAGAVSHHLLSPLSQNLFSRGIMQSGTVLSPWDLIPHYESIENGLELAKKLNCPHDKMLLQMVVECLQNADAKLVMEAEASLPTKGILYFNFRPVVDGKLIAKDPQINLNEGNFKKADILLGSNANEGNYFLMYYFPDLLKNKEGVSVSRNEFLKRVPQLHPCSSIEADALIFEYTNWNNPYDANSNIDALDKIVGDFHFTCSVNDYASYYATKGNNVYVYYFKHVNTLHHWPLWTGSLHADEIEFVFGDPLRGAKNYTIEQVDFSKQIMRYWANFAKTGNPNGNGLSSEKREHKWPAFTVNERAYINLDVNDYSISKGGLRSRQCAFWTELMPKLKLCQENSRKVTASECQKKGKLH